MSKSIIHSGADSVAGMSRVCRQDALIKTDALQSAIFNSANFSSIATDAKGVIQIFNVGAERMLGYTAAEVMNKITPADISDPQEVVTRARALSVEFGTPLTPGFETLVFKASRGIEDIYELTYIRKDGSRFPAVVSVTALRDEQDTIIGYLLIGTDNTARKTVEKEQEIHEILQAADAEEGILLAREKLPELILMDIQLPGMDGLTATRLLKSDAATRDIRIVALTALAMNGDREKIEAAGCDGYITKPIHYQEFLKVVREMVAE